MTTPLLATKLSMPPPRPHVVRRFFPRVIGVFLMLDGVGWVTYLVPPFATSIYSVIAIVAALGEIPLLLWLLIVGVNNQRWKEQAGAAEGSLSI